MEENIKKILEGQEGLARKFDQAKMSHEVTHHIPAGDVAKITGIVGAGALVFGGLLMLEKRLILG